jgi:hypothetical protein
MIGDLVCWEVALACREQPQSAEPSANYRTRLQACLWEATAAQYEATLVQRYQRAKVIRGQQGLQMMARQRGQDVAESAYFMQDAASCHRCPPDAEQMAWPCCRAQPSEVLLIRKTSSNAA